MATFTEITPASLMRLMGTPDAPALIDVRLPKDVAQDPFVLPAARQCPHQDVASLSAWIAGRPVVVICQRGKKLSHGTAALLRSQGHRSVVPEGGALAWAEAGLPRTPLTVRKGTGLWVTRARPKIDQIACPWLIRRWVGPEPRFLLVPAPEVLAVADRFGATAFDIPGAPFEHDGPLCTFHTLISHLASGPSP